MFLVSSLLSSSLDKSFRFNNGFGLGKKLDKLPLNFTGLFVNDSGYWLSDSYSVSILFEEGNKELTFYPLFIY